MTSTVERRQSSVGTARRLGDGGTLGDLRSRWRRLWWLLPLALLAGLLAWWLAHRAQPPLDELALVGARGPACERFVVAADVSGSMVEVASARDAAVAALLAWLPGNLRADDEVAALLFSQEAGSVAGPVTVSGLRGGATLAPGAPGEGTTTAWEPVVDAVSTLPATVCDTSLLVMSDGLVGPLPAGPDDANAQLAAAGVHDLTLLVPSRHLDAPVDWEAAFPYAAPVRFDGTDRNGTATTIAKAIAEVTGQRLERR